MSSWMFEGPVSQTSYGQNLVSICLLEFSSPLENDPIQDSSFLFPALALKSPAIKKSDLLVVLPVFMSFITFTTSVQSCSSSTGSYLTRNVRDAQTLAMVME